MTLNQNQSQELDSIKGVYDHLCRIRDDESSYNSVFLQKAHRLMTVQVWLFASMSFALSQLNWVRGQSAIYFWVIIATAIIGCLCLLVGFYYCIKCLGFEEVSVVGVTKLEEFIKDGNIIRVQITTMYSNLCENIVNVILEHREKTSKRKDWSQRVNKATLIGFIFVAIFVFVSIYGKVITSVSPSNEDITMPNQPTSNQHDLNENQKTPTNKPSDNETTGGDSTNAPIAMKGNEDMVHPLVEDSDTICASMPVKIDESILKLIDKPKDS